MQINYGSQLHYRCSFELSPKEGVSGEWADIIKTIRDWVSMRPGKHESLGRKWFYAGGEWKPASLPGFRVQTAVCYGNGTDQRPDSWGIRYEHPDNDEALRQWQTDIGLTAIDSNRYRFILTTTYSLRDNYIGVEPRVPVPSAPGIVTKLLASTRWSGFFVDDILTAAPVQLRPGEGPVFIEKLTAKERLPIILISLDFESQKPMIEPNKLAKNLAGTAIVYSATSSEVDKELEYLLKKHLRCWNGRIRIYQPGVALEYEPDGKRHRFFTTDEVNDSSPDTILENIVRGIVRRGRVWISDYVTSIEDVKAKQREIRMSELRAKANKDVQESVEWNGLLESDNVALKIKVMELTAQLEELEDDKHSLEENIAGLESDKQSLKAHLEAATNRKQEGNESDSEFVMACRAALVGEPNLEQSLTLILSLYTNRIVVLPSAWRSAKKAERFEGKVKAKDLMLAFATKYWSMLNDGEGNSNAKQVFGDSFAAKESETVEKNLHAKRLRTFDYEGRQVEMMSHLKIGVKPSIAKTWRMHFWWDPDKRKLVIGHCGEHLDHG